MSDDFTKYLDDRGYLPQVPPLVRQRTPKPPKQRNPPGRRIERLLLQQRWMVHRVDGSVIPYRYVTSSPAAPHVKVEHSTALGD